MKDLQSESVERMLETDATPFEREMLQAGALERPSAELMLGMQRALGIGPEVSVPPPEATPHDHGGAAAPVGKAASPWAGGALVKAGIGALVGTGLVVGALMTVKPADPTATTAPATSGTPAAAAAEEPTVVAVPAPVVEAGAAEAARELRLEIEQLDRARTALAADKPARAIELLDAYAARFPLGTLAREAQVLRSKAHARAKLSGAPKPARLEGPAGSESSGSTP